MIINQELVLNKYKGVIGLPIRTSGRVTGDVTSFACVVNMDGEVVAANMIGNLAANNTYPYAFFIKPEEI